MKNYKDKLKSEKGSITSVVLVTILFFITILSTAYIVTATLRKSQLKSEITIKETYESEFNHIDEIYTSLQIKNGEGVKIPDGFYYVGGTVDTGLVISDNSADENKYYGQTVVGSDLQGNQYVWVEVPKTVKVYLTAGTTLDLDTLTGTELEDAYTDIENDLHTYTSTYRNGTDYSDKYYADSTTGWFTDETAYNNAKKAMLKSVYQNGGFYVGRYETGIENSPRTASGETAQTPVVKANAYPYNYVTRTQAKVLADNMYSGDRTSSLMFGVQWDLVLKYLETKAAKKGTALATIQEELKGTATGSTSWGNYADAEIPITNTNAKCEIEKYIQGSYVLGKWEPVPASYTKPNSGTENRVLLSTGANETRNSKQNICDLAGNVSEWTLENTPYDGTPCTQRGGVYFSNGSNGPASFRGSYSTTSSSITLGFRVSIY